jgi:hypothetical protein
MTATNMVARVEQTSPFEGVIQDGPGNRANNQARPPWARPGTMAIHFVGSYDGPAISLLLNNQEADKCFLVVGSAENPAVYRLERKPNKMWSVAYADRHSSVWSVMALPMAEEDSIP